MYAIFWPRYDLYLSANETSVGYRWTKRPEEAMTFETVGHAETHRLLVCVGGVDVLCPRVAVLT